MSFFMHVKDKGGLDDVYNFKTFVQSMILLFQVNMCCLIRRTIRCLDTPIHTHQTNMQH